MGESIRLAVTNNHHTNVSLSPDCLRSKFQLECARADRRINSSAIKEISESIASLFNRFDLSSVNIRYGQSYDPFLLEFVLSIDNGKRAT